MNDPRRQRAATAIKILAVTEPQRLVTCLPRVLPAWDWNLQDLAIAELTRFNAPAKLVGVARTFAEILPEAHPLVVPVMLDEIGVAREVSAIPLLCDIAAGTVAPLRDIFIRIKAVEAWAACTHVPPLRFCARFCASGRDWFTRNPPD